MLRHDQQLSVVTAISLLALIINFLSLNFTSIDIEGERVSSGQNERILGCVCVWGGGGRGGAQKRTRGKGSKLGNLEQMYLLNVPSTTSKKEKKMALQYQQKTWPFNSNKKYEITTEFSFLNYRTDFKSFYFHIYCTFTLP